MKEVTIRCKQVVEYSTTLEVSDEDYERLKELDGDDVRGKDFHFVEQFIDSRDILDADFEYTDLEVECSEEDD